MTSSRRCVLVGTESLLIQCAQVLEQQGHRIVAVVGDRPAIHRYAAERGIPWMPDTQALTAAFAPGSFDVLFSITHLAVLPTQVLALPALAAINFHDGPLPRYAGLNTPVWALLHGERSHGIAWHLMNEGIDRGDILAERHFDLSEDETALTLNTKCFEAAIESFSEWVPALAHGTLKATPQPAGERRYFGRKDRPAAACTIDLAQPAERIAALVRALDFGGYNNPVGTAKLWHAGRLLVVTRASVSDSPSASKPGTLISVDDEHGFVIATSTRDLRLSGFTALDGAALLPSQAAEALGIRAGGQFDALDRALARKLTDMNRLASVHEPFWLQRLQHQVLIELPYVDRSAPSRAPVYEHIDTSFPGVATTDLVTAWVSQLARLTDKPEFDIGWRDISLAELTRAAEPWFAPVLPMRVKVDFTQGFEPQRQALLVELAATAQRQTFAIDVVVRNPELRKAAQAGEPPALPVALVVAANLDDTQPPLRSELTLALAPSGSGVVARWFFDSTKLAPESVRALQRQCHTLLVAGKADPNRPLGELPLMAPDLYERVVTEWNATTAPSRTDACVHRLFEEQATRTPGRIALRCEGQALSYAELNARANQLARRLAAFGVGPDVLVGLCLERSIEMMVGLIAIHKAGGAYVPLDPAYPKDRLAYMVDDSKAHVLLTQQRLVGELPAHQARIICLDADWPTIATEPPAPFDGGAQPPHLASVIYTSGSTG